MSDPQRTSSTSRSEPTALQRLANEAVTDIAGVGHIEPTLSQAIRNLRSPVPEIPAPGSVHFSPGPDEFTNVSLEIGATPDRSAYNTAQDVRATLTQLLIDHGHRPGRITVTVLHLDDDRPVSST